jgi:hypothetical protein
LYEGLAGHQFLIPPADLYRSYPTTEQQQNDNTNNIATVILHVAASITAAWMFVALIRRDPWSTNNNAKHSLSSSRSNDF